LAPLALGLVQMSMVVPNSTAKTGLHALNA